MSIINGAFDTTDLLYTPFEIEKAVQEEPPYIDLTTNFGVKQEPMYKKVGDIRASLLGVVGQEIEEDEEVTEDLRYMIPFMARITSHQADGPNKWLYDWQEMKMEASGQVVFAKGGDSSGKNNQAQNLMEHDNTLTCVGPGVSVDTNAGYPEGWEVQPIGGLLCTVKPVVVMYKVLIYGSISYKYVFQAENAHDGICPV